MRQIDADNLIERIKAAPIREKNKVIGLIHTERTAPIKTGKWTETKVWGGRNFYCSECRFCFIVDTVMLKPMWNYCPNCGCRMEKE